MEFPDQHSAPTFKGSLCRPEALHEPVHDADIVVSSVEDRRATVWLKKMPAVCRSLRFYLTTCVADSTPIGHEEGHLQHCTGMSDFKSTGPNVIPLQVSAARHRSLRCGQSTATKKLQGPTLASVLTEMALLLSDAGVCMDTPKSCVFTLKSWIYCGASRSRYKIARQNRSRLFCVALRVVMVLLGRAHPCIHSP